MAEQRKEKSLKGTEGASRDFPSFCFAPTHSPLLSSPTHPTTCLLQRFPYLPLPVCLRGESQDICICCHNSVRNKLRASRWFSPQHAQCFNGDCQLQKRWIPRLFPSLLYFEKSGMQIDTFSMIASARDKCSPQLVSIGSSFQS